MIESEIYMTLCDTPYSLTLRFSTQLYKFSQNRKTQLYNLMSNQ